MSRIAILFLLTLACGSLAEAAWVPANCGDREGELEKFHRSAGRPDIDKVWQEHRKAVLKAGPRAPLYAPHPYPKNEKEIVENFKYGYFGRLWEGVPLEKLPPKERPVYSALKEGRLRIGVMRVENWQLSRCTLPVPVPYYYVVRLYDSATGREVARGSQFDSGIMGVYRLLPEQEKRLPSLTDLASLLRTRFGRTHAAEQAQYVVPSGLPYCRDETKPCIAFKSQSKTYLLDGGELLYEIDPSAPRETVLEHKARQARQTTRTLSPVNFDAPMVTLGFEWGQARLVGGDKPQ